MCEGVHVPVYFMYIHSFVACARVARVGGGRGREGSRGLYLAGMTCTAPLTVGRNRGEINKQKQTSEQPIK